jgi:hypothetical protein
VLIGDDNSQEKNGGIEGKQIPYCTGRRGGLLPVTKAYRQLSQAKQAQYAEIVEGGGALGRTRATAARVEVALTARYPTETEGLDPAEIIRVVFLDLKLLDEPLEHDLENYRLVVKILCNISACPSK